MRTLMRRALIKATLVSAVATACGYLVDRSAIAAVLGAVVVWVGTFAASKPWHARRAADR
jgi:hypothetical protein